MFHKSKLVNSILILGFLFLVAGALSSNVNAEPPMPKMLKASGYDVGSSAYITVTAAGGGMKEGEC